MGDPKNLVELLNSFLDNPEEPFALASRVDEGLEQPPPFDPAEHVTAAEAITASLVEAEVKTDPSNIEHAHQVAARARTMHGLEG